MFYMSSDSVLQGAGPTPLYMICICSKSPYIIGVLYVLLHVFSLKEEEVLCLTQTMSKEQSLESKLTSELEEASAAMEALKGTKELQ